MRQIHHKTDKRPYAICYHCGESCKKEVVNFDDKEFCCEGCKQVYDLLKENKLCTYYNLNDTPGISPAKGFYSSKYNYLNNAQVAEKIIRFTDGKEAHVVFYIPKIHCSSCIWLLENLHRLNHSISSSTINFLKKEATIIFDVQKIKLSEIVQLLAHIGYEPIINLGDLDKTPARATNTSRIIKIGIAGFCFGNIMMLSFPEYFSFGNFHEQPSLQYFFAYLNLFLSLPVFFYSAS
ncbi:MAG TPA: heavy metal translocating P-type ATPase metal-binding domain-containing protein, partial [Bacteroidia bacterium]|nr:heavy metal translocating P-type ATPase metal-binding domain-containing protein [Bacteroidia bacterium]